MLHPYRFGEKLPVTTWNSKDHRELSLVWPDRRDRVSFTVDDGGRTRLEFRREMQGAKKPIPAPGEKE